MNLDELIERYIVYRQTLGERFKTNASILRAFGRAIGVFATVTDVRPGQVESFLFGVGPVTSAWHARYSALLGFYRYAISRGHVANSPLPGVQPRRPPPFVPYIYGLDELRSLVQATDCYQRRRCRLEPITLRTFVLLLYGYRSSTQRGAHPEPRRCRSGKLPAHGPPHEVLQDPSGPFQPAIRRRPGGLRLTPSHVRFRS